MNDPTQGRVAAWTVEDHLAFDVAFALPRSPIKGLRRALSEDERQAMAKSVVEHLKMCGWKFEMRAIDGHGMGKGA
jgi:hypothetical protein